MLHTQSFPLAPMDRTIVILTLVVQTVPVILFFNGLVSVAALLVVLYLWVWVWMRPRSFTLDARGLEIRWPLRARHIDLAHIVSVRAIDAAQFRSENGLAIRIGVGGLWGGFGLLWTRARSYSMYVSRTSDFVVIECENERPLLITPRGREAFIATLDSMLQQS